MYSRHRSRPGHRSYDDQVPNKTIYVSDSDLPLYQRAQELAGGNLSSAIAAALRRYVDLEDGRQEGFGEITVRVGPKGGRKQRFVGALVGQWASADWSQHYRVYQTRTGKFVLHTERAPEWASRDAQGNPAGWRSWFGLGSYTYMFIAGESTLEVFDSVEQMRDRIPPQFYDALAASVANPTVEDLDI
jgi:EXLDI family protein